MSLSAGAATIAAVWLTVAASKARRRAQRDDRHGVRGDGRALTLHGLSTPGVIFSGYGVVAFSARRRSPSAARCSPSARCRSCGGRARCGRCSRSRGCCWPWCGARRRRSRVPEARPGRAGAPLRAAWIALGVGLAFYGLVGWRAFRTYRLTRRPADLLVVVGTTWLAAALAASLLLTYMDLGWWIGHGPRGGRHRRDRAAGRARPPTRHGAVRPLLGDLSPCQLVAAEEAFLGGQVGALTQLLAERDTYTEEHTRRVARCAPCRSASSSVSRPSACACSRPADCSTTWASSRSPTRSSRPGSLTEEEYDVIKKHSEWGEELLAKLGFPGDVRRLVRDHHERLDGSGYPFGAYGDQLDIETRIICTCDVYDALISPRVYRGACRTSARSASSGTRPASSSTRAASGPQQLRSASRCPRSRAVSYPPPCGHAGERLERRPHDRGAARARASAPLPALTRRRFHASRRSRGAGRPPRAERAARRADALVALVSPRNGHTGIFPLDPATGAACTSSSGSTSSRTGRTFGGSTSGDARRDFGPPVERVAARPAALPYDNESSLRSKVPYFLLVAEVLDGLGVGSGCGTDVHVRRARGEPASDPRSRVRRRVRRRSRPTMLPRRRHRSTSRRAGATSGCGGRATCCTSATTARSPDRGVRPRLAALRARSGASSSICA